MRAISRVFRKRDEKIYIGQILMSDKRAMIILMKEEDKDV